MSRPRDPFMGKFNYNIEACQCDLQNILGRLSKFEWPYLPQIRLALDQFVIVRILVS